MAQQRNREVGSQELGPPGMKEQGYSRTNPQVHHALSPPHVPLVGSSANLGPQGLDFLTQRVELSMFRNQELHTAGA